MFATNPLLSAAETFDEPQPQDRGAGAQSVPLCCSSSAAESARSFASSFASSSLRIRRFVASSSSAIRSSNIATWLRAIRSFEWIVPPHYRLCRIMRSGRGIFCRECSRSRKCGRAGDPSVGFTAASMGGAERPVRRNPRCERRDLQSWRRKPRRSRHPRAIPHPLRRLSWSRRSPATLRPASAKTGCGVRPASPHAQHMGV